LEEIIIVLRYAPILRDVDETKNQPFLSNFEDLYGNKNFIRMTETESLIIGQKDD